MTVLMPSSLAAAKISSWSWLSSGAWPDGAVRPFSFRAAPSSCGCGHEVVGLNLGEADLRDLPDGAGQVFLDCVAQGVQLEGV